MLNIAKAENEDSFVKHGKWTHSIWKEEYEKLFADAKIYGLTCKDLFSAFFVDIFLCLW